jgi:protease PrsW
MNIKEAHLQIILIVLVALAPCAFWLWMIYLSDRCKPGQKGFIVRTFILGVAIGIPVAIIESVLYSGPIQGDISVSTAAYLAFVVAGVTEETAKFLTVRFSAYNSLYFSQPEDGLIYTAAVALGFATLENVIYLISYGLQVILARGLFSNLAHVLFSSLWGFPLGLVKLGYIKHKILIYLGLAGAIAAHGAFDFLFFTGTVYTWLVLPLFLGMMAAFILMMRHSNRIATCKINVKK